MSCLVSLAAPDGLVAVSITRPFLALRAALAPALSLSPALGSPLTSLGLFTRSANAIPFADLNCARHMSSTSVGVTRALDKGSHDDDEVAIYELEQS